MKEKIFRLMQNCLWKRKWVISSLLQKPEFAKIYEEVGLKDRRTTLNMNELFNIYTCVKATEKIKGDIAEVGAYKGSSAKVICMSDNVKRDIHLFDTFAGLPKVSEFDYKYNGIDKFVKGEFYCNLEDVKRYLTNYNVEYYKGLFPNTSGPIKDKKFSFVHFDVDIYQSAKDCLEFFYPRMSKGGIMLSHDFPVGKGVVKAFEEFFKDRPEIYIPLMEKHCMVVKL